MLLQIIEQKERFRNPAAYASVEAFFATTTIGSVSDAPGKENT